MKLMHIKSLALYGIGLFAVFFGYVCANDPVLGYFRFDWSNNQSEKG